MMRDFLFGLVGGTALLMFGVDMMGDGLERCAGNTMKSILAALTGNIYRAVMVSTVLTALVQSSTAIAVLTVGFVNAGLMNLTQAVGVIYGANIGTTVTAQLMAFKLTDFALLFVALGFTVRVGSKSERGQNLGAAILGFGLMFTGLKILNTGVPFLQENPAFRSALITFGRMPLAAVLMGMVATMMVHSSAATVAVTMVLARSGLIDLTAAICLMLGDNIGTCITAQMASLGTNVNARRTAWGHSLYNVIGVVVIFLILPFYVRLTSATSSDISRQIANSHTIFNVLSMVVFLPFTKQYVAFLERVVPEQKAERAGTFLDERLVITPAAGLKACRAEIGQASRMLHAMQDQSFALITRYDAKLQRLFDDNENGLNQYQKNITKYLMNITRQPMSAAESSQASGLLAAVNDVERIGDHFEELTHLAIRKHDENAQFTMMAVGELAQFKKLLGDIVENLPQCIAESHFDIEERMQKVLAFAETMRQNHIARLAAGKCSIDAGVIFFDIINHVESIMDFVEDVANALTQPTRVA
jgi:phosphate:Na+ symporter